MRERDRVVHVWAEKPVMPSPRESADCLPRCGAHTTATSASEPFVIHLCVPVSTQSETVT